MGILKIIFICFVCFLNFLFCSAVAFIQSGNIYLDDLLELLSLLLLKEISWKLSVIIQMQTVVVKHLWKNLSVSLTAFKSSYQQPPAGSAGLFLFLKYH